MDGVKSSTGLDANVAAGLAVVGWWISGLIFYVVEKDSPFVRFYAMQAIFLTLINVALVIISFVTTFVPGLGLLRSLLLTIAGGLPFILWVVTLVHAFQGRVWELPLFGKSARRIAGLQ